MEMHQLRSFFAAVFALVCVVLLAAFGSAQLGMDIPILSDIAGAFGMD